MTLSNDNETDGQTDGRTDRRTDIVRRIKLPPPREEGRITTKSFPRPDSNRYVSVIFAKKPLNICKTGMKKMIWVSLV